MIGLRWYAQYDTICILGLKYLSKIIFNEWPWNEWALLMIVFVILHVGHNFPPKHISSALIQADCRILDVTLAWNERAKWIFLEAGDMCQFLACSLYCKKDRKRQSLWELCKWWTVPNTFDYICEAAVRYGRVTCRKDNLLGNTPGKHHMIFDLECKQRAPSSCSDFLCLLHTYLSSKTDKCIAAFRCSLL